jgi:hypothetical protein
MRSSVVKFMQTPPVSPSEYDISMVLGTIQVPRLRSLSTSVVPKFAQDAPHRELSRTSSETRPSPPLPQGQSSPSQISPSSKASGVKAPGGATISTTANTPPASTNIIDNSSVAGSYYNTGLPPYPNEIERPTCGTMYVDAIIERHARKILSEGKLRDLGKLAAHLDFHLVSWLQKEKRNKGVMVTDFVAALKMIHTEFDWPYPEFSNFHSRTPSTGNLKKMIS